jgi:SSS family solute:Na+ symporter
MDVYKRLLKKDASEVSLVRVGRITTLVVIVISCLLAPFLSDPKFGGVFQFIQQFQGYIWPGVVAAFVMAFILPRAPGSAGVAALLIGPVIYAILQNGYGTWHDIHFLIQVLISFLITCLVMLLITLAKPLKEPRVLPERSDMAVETSLVAKVAGGAVLLGVALFFIVFW